MHRGFLLPENLATWEIGLGADALRVYVTMFIFLEEDEVTYAQWSLCGTQNTKNGCPNGCDAMVANSNPVTYHRHVTTRPPPTRL